MGRGSINRRANAEKFLLNLNIYREKAAGDDLLKNLVKHVKSMERDSNQIIQTRIRQMPTDWFTPLNFAIIDYECYPAKLFGVLFQGKIVQFWIEKEDETFLRQFNEQVLCLVELFQRTYLVVFSINEQQYLEILAREFGKSHDTRFVNELKFINIQTHSQESLVQALYSVGRNMLPDPLLRNSHHVDTLFEMGRFDLIAQHNENCLKSTRIVFTERFLKKSLLLTPDLLTNFKT